MSPREVLIKTRIKFGKLAYTLPETRNVNVLVVGSRIIKIRTKYNIIKKNKINQPNLLLSLED